jgi:hypothetical protein
MFKKFINWLSIGVVIGSVIAWLWYIISVLIEVPEARTFTLIFFSIFAFVLLFFNGLKQLTKL